MINHKISEFLAGILSFFAAVLQRRKNLLSFRPTINIRLLYVFDFMLFFFLPAANFEFMILALIAKRLS